MVNRKIKPTNRRVIAEDRQALAQLAQANEAPLPVLLDLIGIDVKQDLVGADLSGVDLTKLNLSAAKLMSADLSASNLADTKLDGAKLTGASLDHADLSRADLRGAVCCNASLRYACLAHALIEGADFSGADLTGADLTGTGLETQWQTEIRAPTNLIAPLIQNSLRFPVEMMDSFRQTLLWRLVDMGREDLETLDYIETLVVNLSLRQILIRHRMQLRNKFTGATIKPVLLMRTCRDLGLMNWLLAEYGSADLLFAEAAQVAEHNSDRQELAEMLFARACLSLNIDEVELTRSLLTKLRGGPHLAPRLILAHVLVSIEKRQSLQAREILRGVTAFPDHLFAQELRACQQILTASLIAEAGGTPDLFSLLEAIPRSISIRPPYRDFLNAMHRH